MPQVKGVAILGLIKFIKKNTKDTLPKIIGLLPPEQKKYMDDHIILTEWYPYGLYTGLLRTLDKIVGKGDLSYCVEQGRLSAKHDLTTMFRIFMNFSSIQSMVSKVMAVWSSYYDTGKVEVPILTDKEATYLIKDFPDIDIAHVKSVQGWTEQFLLISGKFKNVKSEILKCQCYGDPVTEIHFTFNS